MNVGVPVSARAPASSSLGCPLGDIRLLRHFLHVDLCSLYSSAQPPSLDILSVTFLRVATHTHALPLFLAEGCSSVGCDSC